MKNKLILSTLFSFGMLNAFASPVEYTLDKAHSSVTFKIRHLLSKTVGTFDDFDATISFEPGKIDSLKTEATIQAKSINTKIDKRDEHLKSNDFFDVTKFPVITLKNTKVTEAKDNKAKLSGDMSLHGVTKPVVFDLEYLGNITDPFGTKKAAFTATGKINRKEFGLSWNKAVEAGQLVVGDEVEIEINIEADEVVKSVDDKKTSKEGKKAKKKA